MVAKLVSPCKIMGKGFSFQAMNVSQEQVDKICWAFEQVRDSRPFLQGNSDGWVMVEFWTDDGDAILRASELFAQILGVPLLSGNITWEEIFPLAKRPAL